MSFWTSEQQEIYIKARLRRAAAFLELGNLMQVGRPSVGAAFDSQVAQLLLGAPSEGWAASDELACSEESAGDEATPQRASCLLGRAGVVQRQDRNNWSSCPPCTPFAQAHCDFMRAGRLGTPLAAC